MIKKLLKQPVFIQPLYLIYLFNLIVVFGITFNRLPRETIIGAAFLVFFYLFLMKIENCLLFFLASLPFFVAMPISRGFDSLNIWRIIILIIFGRFFLSKFPLKNWINFDFIKSLPQRIYKRLRGNKIEFWALAYLTIGLLSVLVANEKGAALRRLFYLSEMVLIYPIFVGTIKNKPMVKKAVRHFLLSTLLVLCVAFGQLIFVYFASLNGFWNWWVKHFSLNFYGKNLSNIVSRANTWFSYYPGRPPTLRLFSTFTDSHSFALYLILSSPLVLWLTIKEYLRVKKINPKIIFLGMTFLLIQFSIALSGTRGVWISVAAPLIVSLYFLARKIRPISSKILSIGFSSFVLALLLSSLFLSIPQFNAPVSEIDKSLALKRLKSVIDLEETSNQGRIYIWKESLRAFIKKPILGVGLGNFPVVLGEDVELQKAGSTAHNVYLNSAVEMGILGLIAIIMIFYEILKKAHLLFKRKRYNYLPIFIAFYFIWIFTYSLFDIALFDARVMMLFVFELGILSFFNLEETSNEKA